MNLPINKIICGDCLEVMKDWPDDQIDCCVTSPPYWGLRDYGVDGQLGLEKTPEEYVAKMVEIFREVWRILKPEGTLWLNLGDSYNGSGGEHKHDKGQSGLTNNRDKIGFVKGRNITTLKPKDLCGIPWRVAFALQQNGWYLRQDIIWHKPNPMPESVTDRCTKAHEYIFLLTKRPRYYYDNEAIKEDAKDAESYSGRKFRGPKAILEAGARPNSPQTIDRGCEADGKTFAKVNKRSVWKSVDKEDVWTVTTAPYSEAHFATFPPDLIKPCILAGCPKEVCLKCGKARVRIVERGELKAQRKQDAQYAKNALGKDLRTVQDKGWNTEDKFCPGMSYPTKTTGWTDCGCGANFVPGICFDPFMGSGTVAEVSAKTGRNYVGCELKQEYIDLGRVQAVETGVPVKEARKGQMGLFE